MKLIRANRIKRMHQSPSEKPAPQTWFEPESMSRGSRWQESATFRFGLAHVTSPLRNRESGPECDVGSVNQPGTGEETGRGLIELFTPTGVTTTTV